MVHAYGIRAWKITSNRDAAQAIDWAMRPGAAVVVVESKGFSEYWPAVKGWAQPIEDMSPALPRDEFRANMIVEPLPGWETGEYK